jgi:hypothetical protein
MFTFKLHNLGRSYRGTNSSAKLRSFHMQGRLLADIVAKVGCCRWLVGDFVKERAGFDPPALTPSTQRAVSLESLR